MLLQYSPYMRKSARIRDIYKFLEHFFFSTHFYYNAVRFSLMAYWLYAYGVKWIFRMIISKKKKKYEKMESIERFILVGSIRLGGAIFLQTFFSVVIRWKKN